MFLGRKKKTPFGVFFSRSCLLITIIFSFTTTTSCSSSDAFLVFEKCDWPFAMDSFLCLSRFFVSAALESIKINVEANDGCSERSDKGTKIDFFPSAWRDWSDIAERRLKRFLCAIRNLYWTLVTQFKLIFNFTMRSNAVTAPIDDLFLFFLSRLFLCADRK